MATEYVTGTPENDLDLNGGDGVNEYDGGLGDDVINGADGENTIIYEVGDGTDTITFAAPRPYQFAGYLDEVMRALDHDFGGDPAASYSNEYFANADSSLFGRLPLSVSTVLRTLQQGTSGEHGEWIPGSVDAYTAETAFTALKEWINAPVTNVIKFGPGISLSDLSIQMTSPASSFDVPSTFVVAVGGKEGMVFNMLPPDVAAGAFRLRRPSTSCSSSRMTPAPPPPRWRKCSVSLPTE